MLSLDYDRDFGVSYSQHLNLIMGPELINLMRVLVEDITTESERAIIKVLN